MSEPIETLGLGDVLSSVRRLVAEDFAAANVVSRVTPTAKVPEGKLMLTPTLRVHPAPGLASDEVLVLGQAVMPDRASLSVAIAPMDDPAGAEAVAAVLAGVKTAPAMAGIDDAEVVGDPTPGRDLTISRDHALATQPGAAPPWDEAVMRDLIRDVIKSEFQGEMGERITRNMRKLVRAEVNRVLASHGLT